MWRYSATDNLVGEAPRIFWKPSDDDQILAFTGSLGVAILELELSEGVDITELLDESPYLDRQYTTTVQSRNPDFIAASWEPATSGIVLGRRSAASRTAFAIDPCLTRILHESFGLEA